MITLPTYFNKYRAKDIVFSFVVQDDEGDPLLTFTTAGNDNDENILLNFAPISTTIQQELLTTLGATSVEIISNMSIDAFYLEYRDCYIDMYKEGETPITIFQGKIAPPVSFNPTSGIFSLSLVTSTIDAQILSDTVFTAKKPSEHIRDLVNSLDNVSCDEDSFDALDADGVTGDEFTVLGASNTNYKTLIEQLAWIGGYGLLLKNNVLYGYDLKQPLPEAVAKIHLADAFIDNFEATTKDETNLFTRLVLNQGTDKLTWTRNEILYGERVKNQVLVGYDILSETVTSRVNYWLYQYSNLWRTVRMNLPLNYSNLEVFDIVEMVGFSHIFRSPPFTIKGRVLAVAVNIEGYVSVTVETDVNARTNAVDPFYWDTGNFLGLVEAVSTVPATGSDFVFTWRRLVNGLSKYNLLVQKDGASFIDEEYDPEVDVVVSKTETLTPAESHTYDWKVRPWVDGAWGNWSNTLVLRYENDLVAADFGWVEKPVYGEAWTTKSSEVFFTLPEDATKLEFEYRDSADDVISTVVITGTFLTGEYTNYVLHNIPQGTLRFRMRMFNAAGWSLWTANSNSLLHDVPDASGVSIFMDPEDENYPWWGAEENPEFYNPTPGFLGGGYKLKMIFDINKPRASTLTMRRLSYFSNTSNWLPTGGFTNVLAYSVKYINWFETFFNTLVKVPSAHRTHVIAYLPEFSNAYGKSIGNEPVFIVLQFSSSTTTWAEASKQVTSTPPVGTFG